MNNKKNIRRFIKILLKYNKIELCLSFFIMLIVSILGLIQPQLIKMILDDAIIDSNIQLLIKLVVIYGTISILSSLLNVILQYMYSKMKKRVYISLKIKLLKHISKLSGDYFINIKTGNILSMVENDIYTIENFGVDILFSIIVDVFTAIMSLFFLIKMQSSLLVLVIVLQLLLMFSQSKFNKIISRKTLEIRNRIDPLILDKNSRILSFS